jgi:hypothetical protein
VFSLFLSFESQDPTLRLSAADRARLDRIVRSVVGVTRAELCTPAVARDRYYAEDVAPVLMLQLHVPDLPLLERAIARGGALTAINADQFPVLGGTRASHQLMLARPFPVPGTSAPRGRTQCAYMVDYDGTPRDLNAWLGHYLLHHPPIMADFPAIREIEVCTRVDWIDEAPWTRVNRFQRNKVVFDTPRHLEEALNSPTRDRMKDDRDNFPAFEGHVRHVPMMCERLIG